MRSTFEPAGVSKLEGLLRPDTYKISESQDEIAILQTMAKTFDERATKLGLATANVEGHGAYDIIKVASMIESEAKVAQDRPLIASVIYNRLASTCRSRSTRPSSTDGAIRRTASSRPSDLEIKSPYNTYLQQRAAADADRGGQRHVAVGGAGTPPRPTTSTTCSPARTATTRSRRTATRNSKQNIERRRQAGVL